MLWKCWIFDNVSDIFVCPSLFLEECAWINESESWDGGYCFVETGF